MTQIIDFKNQKITLKSALNNIIHGDCLEVMKSLPDKSIDVIVTSPPYNFKNSTGNGLKSKSPNGTWERPPLIDGYDEYNDDLPYDVYIKWQSQCLTEMMRLLKDDGAIFYNNKNKSNKLSFIAYL